MLLNEAAKYGGLTFAPLRLQHEIGDLETQIEELNEKLKELEEDSQP